MSDITEKICRIARECGEFIKNADRSHMCIDAKEGPANFVTEYDKKVEQMLREKLASVVPDAVFMGEEGDDNRFTDKGKCFIVDPIDGTTNFIKDYHMSCISIGLYNDGSPWIGVVYNPYLDEMFWAEKGKGAFCNGKKLSVSKQPLSNGIVLFGTAPYHEELNEKSFELAFKYFKKALDIRRSGSAALDLCAIASGRAELYFELLLSPWDYAAGALLVTEAGGVITDADGNPLKHGFATSVIARNM